MILLGSSAAIWRISQQTNLYERQSSWYLELNIFRVKTEVGFVIVNFPDKIFKQI
jgi:hypothetical protein